MLTVRPMQPRDVLPAARLLAGQLARWHALDGRLQVPSRPLQAAEGVIRYDLEAAAGRAQVAEADGALVGYLSALPRTLDFGDVSRVWMPDRFLSSEFLLQAAVAPSWAWETVLPPLWAAVAAQEAAWPVVLALVPARGGLDGVLAGLGFRYTSVFAYRPLDNLPLAPAPDPPGVQIRPATPADHAAVVALFDELVVYHVVNDPAADREHPLVLSDFADLLAGLDLRRWLLLVAAGAGGLLGFGLASLDFEERSPTLINMLPPGRVGFIHEFSVAARARGQGIGRALHARLALGVAALARDAPMHGLWLIYRTSNPTSSRFWPAVGYRPLYGMWRKGGWE